MDLRPNTGFAFEELPEMPESLSEPARQHWNELIPLIYNLNRARPADIPILIILCEAVADLNAMQASLRRDGFTSKTPTGAVKGNPVLRGLETCRSKVEHLMDQFGLMPGGYRLRSYAEYLEEVEHRKQREAERENDGYDYD